MTNSPLRNSIKAQMSKQSQTSIKTSALLKGSLTNHDTCKQAIKKIPDKNTSRDPSLRCTPSKKGMPTVPSKTLATRSENLKVRTKRNKERVLQKIDSFPRLNSKDNKMMNGLYNTLTQISHTGLARSPYFDSLSNILKGKDCNQDKIVKTQKRNESKKLPNLKNCLNQRTSNASMKSNKAVQTSVATSTLKNVVGTKKATTKGTTASCKNEDSKCSSTKLPIVTKNRGNLKQKPSDNNLKASAKMNCPQPSKVNVPKLYTIPQRPPTPERYFGYWDNEIRNYYNWTSFCLMRRYRSDTKMLKQQLKKLGREGCSINDVIWREAETFRKNIEKDRKKLDAVLKITTKDKPNTTKKKPGTNKKLPSKNGDSLPVIKTGTPERKRCATLVPPPSASESLFIHRKQERPPTSSLSQKTFDLVDSANKQFSKSISDQSIFPGGNSGKFVSKGLQYRSPVSDTSFDAPETNNTPNLNEQKSKFKSKFTLKSERLSFVHLKKAAR